jgi:hypothetical protein
MKRVTSERIGEGLVIGICFTAYIFLVLSVLAAGLDLSLPLAS